MTPEQFAEHKKLLEEIKSEVFSLNEKVLVLFNVVNKTSNFLSGGSNNTAVLEDQVTLLEDMLTELKK